MPNNTDFPEYLHQVFEGLEKIKKEVHDLGITLLLEGELKPLSNTPLGETYPYDFNLYVKDSFDPDVQALSLLIDKIEETIATIRENNKV